MGKSGEIVGEDFSTCQERTKIFGVHFGANFGANFGENFGNFVSNFATFFGNFVQQKSANKGLPLPLGRGVRKTKSKNGRSRPRKPLFLGFLCSEVD